MVEFGSFTWYDDHSGFVVEMNSPDLTLSSLAFQEVIRDTEGCLKESDFQHSELLTSFRVAS